MLELMLRLFFAILVLGITAGIPMLIIFKNEIRWWYEDLHSGKIDALAEHLGKHIVKIPAHYEVKDAPTKE